MEKTSFHGSSLVSAADSGFSLFGTLCVICALSLVFGGVASAVVLRHRLVEKQSARFYTALEQENADVRQRTARGDYAAD